MSNIEIDNVRVTVISFYIIDVYKYDYSVIIIWTNSGRSTFFHLSLLY